MMPPPAWDRLEAIAREEVAGVLRGLSPELRDSASAVALCCEAVPANSGAADGLGDDLLGLFIGPDFVNEEGHGSLPPQIILFLESLWEFSECDEAVYREEVRTTYLHELGHYLGLDEDEVEERGL
ncbi:MAG TPA: metallopeptidase family protein [Verrucomicrobiae bacterium]|jgi:predicted Zn-dependent protease with MMP-like domain|nr:metallopeptidase family protein [Verrucomicrobiae bacterium]